MLNAQHLLFFYIHYNKIKIFKICLSFLWILFVNFTVQSLTPAIFVEVSKFALIKIQKKYFTLFRSFSDSIWRFVVDFSIFILIQFQNRRLNVELESSCSQKLSLELFNSGLGLCVGQGSRVDTLGSKYLNNCFYINFL